MPQLIEFGGTNGVSVLNLGLPGGTPATGSTLDMTEAILETTLQQAAMPQVDMVAVQRTGVHGRVLIGRGILVASDHETLNAFESDIDKHQNAPPTQLVDSVRNKTFGSVVLVTWRRLGRRMITASGKVAQEFEITFKDLRAV